MDWLLSKGQFSKRCCFILLGLLCHPRRSLLEYIKTCNFDCFVNTVLIFGSAFPNIF